MRFSVKILLAASTLLVATPALADVDAYKTSYDQGILVHGNGGSADVGTDVTGDLGSGPGAVNNYVHFTGTTDASTNNDVLRLNQGSGQAQLTGAVISGQSTYNLEEGDIFLSNHDSFTWIELSFEKITGTTIDFAVSILGEPDALFSFDIDPSGLNKFGFLASNGQVITNLHYTINGGSADAIRQVRILREGGQVPVPEPATWAMMLLGFGAVGFVMRRRRGPVLTQLA